MSRFQVNRYYKLFQSHVRDMPEKTMNKIDYFICHDSWQVSRLQQTHIEGLLLRSHRCLLLLSPWSMTGPLGG